MLMLLGDFFFFLFSFVFLGVRFGGFAGLFLPRLGGLVIFNGSQLPRSWGFLFRFQHFASFHCVFRSYITLTS
jgi:hypothetical protein